MACGKGFTLCSPVEDCRQPRTEGEQMKKILSLAAWAIMTIAVTGSNVSYADDNTDEDYVTFCQGGVCWICWDDIGCVMVVYEDPQ